MNKFMSFMEKYLVPIAGKLAGNKHLNAIKDGFVFTIPFLIVGSFVLLLVNLPLTDPNNFMYVKWYTDLMASMKADLVQPFYVSMGILSLLFSFGLGYSLAGSYKLNQITSGFVSLYAFLILSAKVDWAPITEIGGKVFLLPEGSWMPLMDARYLDAKGLFVAIIGGIVAIEILRFLIEKKLTIKMPEAVPPAIAKSFEILIPVAVITVLFQAVSVIVQKTSGIMVPELVQKVLSPLLNASNTLPSVILVILITHLLWFFGLHGGMIMTPIVNAIALSNLTLNQEALKASEAIPTVFAGGFLDSFAYVGGVGCTLGLAIAMVRSRNEYIKSIGKLSLIPGIFNINEPMMFGLPLVMNPILLMPFLLAPIINVTIAWFATSFGLIGKIVALVPWTTPGPLAAFLATNFSVVAIFFSCLSIVISYLIYTPFLKIYVKTLNDNTDV